MDQEPKQEQEQKQEQEPKQEQEQGSIEEAPVQKKQEEDNQEESEYSKKTSPFLTTVPTAVTKFGSFRKTNMSPLSLPSHGMELSEAKKEAHLKESFGVGPLVFPALHRFNNIDAFLAFYCVVVLAQGFVFGLVDLSTEYFEKEFYMSSPEKFALSFAYDLTSLLSAILVAYYGSRYNRSKWVAAAAFLVGLGSVLCAVPFMKYEVIPQIKESEELCIDEEHRAIPNCLENLAPHRSETLYFFILGQCLQGIAGMPIYILGVIFLFDHSATHLAGIYLGAKKIQLRKEKEPSTVDKHLKNKKFGPRLKDLLRALQCLVKSPLLMCHAMCKATESLAYIGAAEFLPKYLENQFLLTPSLATLLTGCVSLKELNNEKTYYNCSCIKKGLTNADSEGDLIDAIPGKCDTKCNTLPLFFAFFFSSIAFSSSASTPITLIILREHVEIILVLVNSEFINIYFTIDYFIGSIPGPLLFQLTASSSCIYWDVSKCGSKGRCWIYSKTKMAFILLGLCK
ncbi:Solute carrier organic anion transporter family member 6A1 [Microtus ochrogaster]|uniref:Solute carrier organic anion transporter family member 6A1 n=1 Tax=Microtus ochrogaster TaxID=79684 RepID=A0A8J6GDV8_MICOH|nr:Solute carrier organic anion transporter family member 6A1 [Microtus ochrogaster]